MENKFLVRKEISNAIKRAVGYTSYNEFIAKVLVANPNMKLDSNSMLAKLAIKEYNTQIKTTPTLVRPPIPEWFCGYQDTESGQLYLSEYELERSKLKQINISSEIPLSSTELERVRYEPDKCLEFGLPGSYSYTFCNLGSVWETEVYNIDWSTAFYPTELITDILTKVADTIYDAVKESIAVESASINGNEEWDGTSGVGVWDKKDPKIISATFKGSGRSGFIVLDTEGIVGNPKWKIKAMGPKPCRAVLYINGGKTDHCMDKHLKKTPKTLENMWGSEAYWYNHGGKNNPIKRGDKVKITLKSEDNKESVDYTAQDPWPFDPPRS